MCGFTREVVTALFADIETREWRRRDRVPENPRASTTDDVECFFSITRGPNRSEFYPETSPVCVEKIVCGISENNFSRPSVLLLHIFP